MWSRNQIEKLYDNKYALDLSNSLFFDVYPNISFLMIELGITETSFVIGNHVYDEHQFYRCLIQVTNLQDNSNGLTITLQKVINVQRPTGNNDDMIQEIEVLEYRDFTFGFEQIYSEVIYYTESFESKILNTRDPILHSGMFFDMALNFKTAIHFYLFYCENVVKICEDLKTNYRDGFLKLRERINLLIFPLERKVLIEKNNN